MCTARNADGSVSDRHIFNVLKPGSPPENIQTIIDPDNRVTISWEEPKYPNGPIMKYKVYVTSDPAEPISYWRIYEAEPSETPHLILERGQLQPETPYYVRIAAVGQEGDGLQSDIVLFETVSGAPIDAPKDVLATVEQDNTMDISWTGPSVPNGPIQAYTVYFTPLDEQQSPNDAYKQWDKIVVRSNDNFGSLKLNKETYDILPNRLYRIRISATNDLSEGPASEPVTVRTESGETPPVIRLEPADNPATVPPYGSIAVRCTATGIPQPTVIWIIGTNASDVIRGPILQLTDLRKDETATCKAENNGWTSARSITNTCRWFVLLIFYFQIRPGTPPNEIVVLPLENQQANIEWTTPDSPNGKITDYVIHYGEVFNGEALPRSWETVRVSADEPQKYRLTGLKPKTNYAIRLQAISDRGPGVLSDPIKITTVPLAPAIVQPADVKVHDNNTVAVLFDAPEDPEDPGKPIKEFVVQYTDDDPTSEDAQWKEMFWTEPDDDFSVSIPIGGEHFKPDTKYSIRITARGEIDSPPSEPIVFQTGDGIIPPEKPQINVDVPDNVIRVPAGSDYTVGCSSTGFPPPRVFWVDEDEQPLSDGPMLRLQDVKETIKAKCVAENDGGRAETPFEIFVTGPGNAPSNIRLNSVKPRTINIYWDPPTMPNGNITRYIIYYTPLDDQNIIYQMGQIPKKPITEWMTFHKDSQPLMGTSQRGDLTDFIEPDTAYAVVLQAVNQDGPGPYSEQHTIRTMSRAREGPPVDLRVEPESQRSANVEWRRPITSEQPPIGYELYYIKADAKIWEEDLASIDDWNMIPITEKDGEKLYYKIDGLLEPDTEYVFRMRAIYPDGPGVFSDACITKTLPDGNAPYVLISNGDHGIEGKTEITILPGSALDLSCNATGQPRPSVKWIRSGYYPIDPAWVSCFSKLQHVKADEKYAVWFLKVSNITEDTSFNCVAQSPLGFANWTISVRLAPELQPTWKNDFIVAKNEDGEVVLHFTDDLPDYLKGPHNPWNIYWTDNPSKPFETWNLIASDDRPLDRIDIPEMEPGSKYHLVIEQPSAGIKTPIFEIMTPKPASDIRVGTDINGETVLDFKPALATEPIRKYIIKYWPDNNPSAVMYMETPVNVTDKIVLDGLQPDTEYNFMVTAKFDDGDNLASEPTKIRTPSGDIQCQCAHACMFEEDEEGVITASCYCHNGFKLAPDKKSCEPIEEDEEAGIVQVTPPTLIPESEHPKELSTVPTVFDQLIPKEEKEKPSPTDEFGGTVWQDVQVITTDMDKDLTSTVMDKELDTIAPLSTDSTALPRVVDFEGEPLPTNEYGQVVDNLGNPITWDEEGRPIGPNGIPLGRNYKGEYIYPIVGKDGQPLPTDMSMRPIYPIIGPDDQLFERNQEGLPIDQYGQIIPTDSAGHPISVDGSPYPTDEQGRYIISDSKTVTQQVAPTDELGRIIYPISYPDGVLLATAEDGRFVSEYGELIPTNDAGMPVNEKGEVLPKDSDGNFIYVGDYILPTDSDGQPVKVQYRGRILKSDKMGRIIGPNGQVIPVNDYGYPIDGSNTVLPTTSDGIFILSEFDKSSTVAPSKKSLRIIGPDGYLLPTTEDGTVLDPSGKIIPTNNIGEPVNYRNEPLPTNREGEAIYPKDGLDCPIPPTDQHGRPVYSVVGPDGRLLTREHDGTAVDPDGNLLPTNAAGVPIDRRGRPLPSDKNGTIIYPARGIDAEPLPTDSYGRPVYPVIGPDGNLLPTDGSGRVVGEDGRPIPTNAAGVPVNERGEPLPIDENGYIRYPATVEQIRPEYTVIGIDGEPLPRHQDGSIIGPDNRPIPTDASGYPVDYRGRPLPRDRSGKIIYPANGLDVEPVPTDQNGRPVYLVIGPDGQLLPKDSGGAVTDINGRPIPTNAAGIPLDQYGKPLSIDRNGYVFYPQESYSTESTETPEYTIVGPDGSALHKNADGAFVDPYGRPIPRDSHGYPVNNQGRPLPRDHLGNFVYPIEDLVTESTATDASTQPTYTVIGLSGEVLPRGQDGELLDPHGIPIPTNVDGIPVNNLGEPLPRDKDGNIIYPAGGLDVALVPTDSNGRPIYEVIGPDGKSLPSSSDGIILDKQGQPIPTNAAGVPVDRYGRPLQQTDSGEFVYPVDEIYTPVDKEKKKQVYPVIGPDGEMLPQDSNGNVLDPFGQPIPTNEYGIPVDSAGRPLPRDNAGNVIFPAGGLDAEPMPTDKSGKPVYPVIGPDGHPLPTTADHEIISPDGNIVPVNAAGVPTNHRGELLPKDKGGNFIYPATGLDVELPPTDESGKLVYPVVNHRGESLPTNEDGARVDLDGTPIPTNRVGLPVDEHGRPLPKDAEGNFIFGIPIRPTDEKGLPIYMVVGPDGKLLPTDESGKVIGPDGHPVPVDSEGKLINNRGEPLPTDRSGNFIYPLKGLDAELLPTDSNGLPIYSVVDPDGQILPTNDQGLSVNDEGEPLPTNAAGVPIDDHGEPLPTDSKGNMVYRKEGQKPLSTEEFDQAIYPVIDPDQELLPTDQIGVIAEGQPIPTDESSRPISGDFSGKVSRVEPGVETLPTDSNGRPVYPVVGPDYEPLPTNEDGAVVDRKGVVIPTNSYGVPIDEKGIPLPTHENGVMIYQEPTLRRTLHNVIGPDGNYLPLDTDGTVLDPEGKTIPTDESGNLVDTNGRPLPKDRDGNIIYIPKGLDARPLPTDQNGKPIYPVIGADKVPLRTDEHGRPIDKEGEQIPTNAAGIPVDSDGEPLPIDAEQNVHYLPEDVLTVAGRPVIGPDGVPLPTTSDGSVFGPDGKPLPTDQNGWPLDKDGKRMPTDAYNNIIYPVRLPDGSVLPTDSYGRPVYPVIGPNGELLPTTESGLVIGLDGSPLPTNAAGKPIGPDASPLPTDEAGNVIHLPPEEPSSTFATNEYGYIVYPIVDTEGKLLDKDDSGAYIAKNGIPVELNENHLPVDPDGNVLPTDSKGNYIFPDLDIMGKILPTDKTSQALYPVIGPDGQLLPTDSSGAIVGLDGKLLPTDQYGKPIGPSGKQLPTDDEGRFIYDEVAKRIKVVDGEGRPLPTDELGRYLLAPNRPIQQNGAGRLIGPDGQPLPTDDSGNYVYRYKMEDEFGHPLPTNEDGFYVGKDGMIITTEPTGPTMDGKGVVLPTDEYGTITMAKVPTQTKSYQILDDKNEILPTDESGNFLDHKGYPINENEEGKPISADGVVLPTTDMGYYIFTTQQKPVIPMDESGIVIGPDQYPLPIDQYGEPVHLETTSVSMQDTYGIEGKLLPTNEYGEQVTKEREEIRPTDEYGKYIQLKPDGKPYPTDQDHRPIYPVIGYDGQLLPTNDEGLAVDVEGHPIPTNNDGRPLDEDGVLLPIDSRGNAVYDGGRKTCNTQMGVMDIAVVINVETLSNDNFEHIKNVIQTLINEYFDLSPDVTQFALVKYSGTAEVPITLGGYNEKLDLLEEINQVKIDHIKEHPRLIVGINAARQQFVSFGRENAGKLMIVFTDGQDIYSEDLFKDNAMPMLVVGKREFEEEIRDWTKSYILIDSWEEIHANAIAEMIEKECLLGKIFMPTIRVPPRLKIEKYASSPLPTDEFGHAIVVPTSEQIVLATDEYGHVIYPIKDASGRLLPMNENGLVMDRLGRIVEFDDYGKPIGPDRKPLPTDESGAYIYPDIDTDGGGLNAVGVDGKPLPNNQKGTFVDMRRPPVAESYLAGQHQEGLLHPPEDDGKITTVKRTGKTTGRTRQTAQSLLYPVIGPDNILSSKDDVVDVHVNNVGRTIEPDDIEKSIGPDEQLMPTSDAGGFIYPKYSKSGKLSRNDSNIRLVYPVVRDSILLPTTKNGLPLIPDASTVDRNFHGKPFDIVDDEMMPPSEYNQDYYEGSDDKSGTADETESFINSRNKPLPIEVDEGGKPVGAKVEPEQIPKGQKATVVDLFGRPLSTNKYGDSLYADGSVVPTDASRQPVGRDGSPMPLDHRGRYVSDYVPDGTILPESELLAEASTCDKIDESAHIIFIVESSSVIGMELDKIKLSLLDFIKKNINWDIAKVGMISYGSTVDINLDIGNYQNYNDLKESILNSPLIGGAASDDDHAFRTALQLFRENYDHDNGELIMHVFKTPLSKDAQVIADHLKMNETISILSLGSDQWYRLKDDEESKKLRSDMCLMLMQSHLAQTRKSSGELKDEMKFDLSGDESGHLMHSIVDSNGQLLATDSSGSPIDSFERPILYDNDGVPIGPDGRSLPRDDQGRYTYPALGISDIPLPTDANKRPLHLIKGSDGHPLPTDRTGRATDNSGKPIPTDDSGKPIGVNGSPLPTDANGWFLFAEEEVTKVLSKNINDDDQAIYPTIDPDGNPLSTDSSGAYYDHYPRVFDDSGKPLPTDYGSKHIFGAIVPDDVSNSENERVVYSDVVSEGKLLPTDENGAFVDPNGKAIPTDKYRGVIGADKYHVNYSEADEKLLPTDESGILLDPFGTPIPADDTRKPLSPDGKVLPTDKNGRYLHFSAGKDGRVVPGKKLKRPIHPTKGTTLSGTVIPTDDQGFYIYPEHHPDKMLSPDTQEKSVAMMDDRSLLSDIVFDGKSTAKSSFRKPIDIDGTDADDTVVFGKEKELFHTVVNKDGTLLPTDQSPRHLDSHDEESVAAINTSKIYSDGRKVTMGKARSFIYPAIRHEKKLLPTDDFIDRSDMFTKDDKALSTNREGVVQDDEYRSQRIHSTVSDSRSVPRNESGHLIDILSTKGTDDRYIHSATESNERLLSSIKSDRPTYIVVSHNGEQLLVDGKTGMTLDSHGSPMPTNEYGKSVGLNGSPLPTDESARFVYDSTDKEKSVEGILPTDQADQLLYPVIDPDVELLPVSSLAATDDQFGKPIAIDKTGLPTDESYNYQYAKVGDNGRIFSSEMHEQSHSSVLSSREQVLPTDEWDMVKDIRPKVTDSRDESSFSSKDSLASRSDDLNGRKAEKDKVLMRMEIDENGRATYPFLNSDGELLPTDDTGRPVDRLRKPVTTDEAEMLIDHYFRIHGQSTFLLHLLSTLYLSYLLKSVSLYLALSTIGLRSDTNYAPIEKHELKISDVIVIVDLDGKPMPTDRFGRPLATDGSVDGREDVEVLPFTEKDRKARPIESISKDDSFGLDDQGISVDSDNKHIYPTAASRRKHRPTGSHRKPAYQIFDENGRILPTDESGAHINTDGKPVPTNFYGEPLNSERNSVLPTDISGRYHISSKKLTDKQLSTDRDDSFLHPTKHPHLETISTTSTSLPILILLPDGRPLSAGDNGVYVDDKGRNLVHIDQNGRPVASADGTPLQEIDDGKYLYPHEPPKEKPFAGADDNDYLLDPDHRHLQLHDRSKPGSVDEYGKSTTPWIISWTSPSSHCVISSNVDMLLLLDSSSSVKVIDHRIMKDFIKNFLINYFNLQRNYVRVGVMKYGDKVEIPVSLGDYNSQAELLSRISEIRRMRGEANLGQALLDASGEFLIFGSNDVPRVVIIFSNGQPRGDLKENARLLRDDTKASVFLVDVGNQGDNEQNLAIVGESNSHRIISIDEWNGIDSEILRPFANELCKILPRRQDKTSKDGTWPTRQTEMRSVTLERICNGVDFQADVMFVLDSSDKVTPEEYANLKEDISMLIDETFDLSPDIVRVGLVEYSDKASVPVPLGYYDHKVQLLEDISSSEQLGGLPIILRGLHAAREQFLQHGRNGVSKILLLVTSGANRGNVAFAADNLREQLNVSIFVLIVNGTQGAQMMLNRLVGVENVQRRVIPVPSVTKLQETELLQIGQALCGSTDVAAATIWPAQETPHRTTKRDVTYAESKRKKDKISRIPMSFWKTTTEQLAPIPLCKDGLLRPYQLSIVVDNTARSPEKDFRLVLNHIANFLKMRFSPESRLMQLNLIGVDSDGINLKVANFGVDMMDEIFAKLTQKRQVHLLNDEISPKLGRGIEEAIVLAKEHAVKGVIQIILIISADGTSSDDAIQAAEYARKQYGYGIVAISVRAPSSALLKELSLGSPTKVIHFPDWSIGNELFQSWIAHAFCSYVSKPVTRKAKLTRMTRPPIRKTSKISTDDATNVEVTPLGPNSLIVSWTCCTNNKADYIISYTPDSSLPKENWQKLSATCRDSFGRKIDGLPSDNTYTVCVETLQRFSNKSVPLNLNECETMQLTKDVNECQQQNGGCSHGCVNTPGDFYCACPHGMMRDPVDPKVCINVAGSFDRIAALLGQYLHANRFNVSATEAEKNDAETDGKVIRYKAIVKSEDDKTISFEWSLMPAVVRRALKWLF
uniref:Fibronectin type-III domain-containing protein n=1 Tax=Elaeophora elaphi TaxID=1147741 RepID=A0A0R3RV16_9BILA